MLQQPNWGQSSFCCLAVGIHFLVLNGAKSDAQMSHAAPAQHKLQLKQMLHKLTLNYLSIFSLPKAKDIASGRRSPHICGVETAPKSSARCTQCLATLLHTGTRQDITESVARLRDG